ncbi:hypothetical protein OVA24_03495 [Luteolibacter sp. SL250]|uniref:hypothetical protein n=1 Tax=Luteolibacter sp. SL250 TaxID=2995170 RepID=UPI002271772B|nr:hypothetical protein [Luteolibacter sp. SL250]WAC20442.1 hypothetical protein OVA24_03495 [Luteolibacter sp. SL250]
MQTSALPRIIMGAAFTLLALIATLQIFTSQGNVLGNSFRYLTPLALALAMVAPRMSFYLLLMAGAYLDCIKRFMIMDSRFSDVDLAFMLSFAPALVAGMVLKFLFSAVMGSGQVSKREVVLFFVITFVCCVMGGTQLMMEGGLRNAGNAVNTVAYLYMPLLLPRIFNGIADLKKLMLSVVLIYLPAALWAIHQAYFGIADFEMQYLLSGMTIEVRQLDEEVFRNMGTMVSAHALSMVASILFASLLLPVIWKKGKISLRAWLNPVRWLVLVLFMASAYFTFSRTGWACAIIALLAFCCLQSKLLTYTAFFSALAGISILYLSADHLLTSRVMVNAQEQLFEKFGASPEIRQTLVLGTLDARLESMASFVNDADLWTPFGMKIAGTEPNVNWIHDILTETLIKIGYIPLSIAVLGLIVGTLYVFRLVFRMPKGPHRTLITYFFALGIGMVSGGFSQGIMILYFPINLFWCMFFGIAFSIYQWWLADASSLKIYEPLGGAATGRAAGQGSGLFPAPAGRTA